MRLLFLALLPLSLYCVYGFTETYQTAIEDRMMWRAIYCGAFLACIAGMSFLMGVGKEAI